MDELRRLTAQMAREGIRRLLVLSGDDAGLSFRRNKYAQRWPETDCGLAHSRCLRRTSRLQI